MSDKDFRIRIPKWQICCAVLEKPVVLVVNKVDSFQKLMADVYEFYNLGIGDPIPISASSRLGLGDMLDAVAAHFPGAFCRGRRG